MEETLPSSQAYPTAFCVAGMKTSFWRGDLVEHVLVRGSQLVRYFTTGRNARVSNCLPVTSHLLSPSIAPLRIWP